MKTLTDEEVDFVRHIKTLGVLTVDNPKKFLGEPEVAKTRELIDKSEQLIKMAKSNFAAQILKGDLSGVKLDLSGIKADLSLFVLAVVSANLFKFDYSIFKVDEKGFHVAGYTKWRWRWVQRDEDKAKAEQAEGKAKQDRRMKYYAAEIERIRRELTSAHRLAVDANRRVEELEHSAVGAGHSIQKLSNAISDLDRRLRA